jgi:hypothetical protein
MLDQRKLNYIGTFLDLEKLIVRQKVELLCFLKNNSDEIKKKIDIIKTELGPSIDLKIVEEGEIDSVKRIEFCEQSSDDGFNPFR